MWRSPAWTGGVRNSSSEALVAGDRYFEFIHADDLFPLLAWFADESKTVDAGIEGAISFRCIVPDTGAFMRCIFTKTPFGTHWLVIGTAVAIENEFPPPPCTMVELGVDQETAGEKADGGAGGNP